MKKRIGFVLLGVSVLLNIVLAGFLFGKVTVDSKDAKMLYEQAVDQLQQAVSSEYTPLLKHEEKNPIKFLHLASTRLNLSYLNFTKLQHQFDIYGVSVQPVLNAIQTLSDKSNQFFKEEISDGEVQELIQTTTAIVDQLPKHYDVGEIRKAVKDFKPVQ
ncbi:hypothetical protein [Paenibacillus chitinolyticus]|uniref:hypothetical protein n=1 Tax=Paenibacillus chitinolyticus TaxID=79263 RepID=UPI003D0854D7